MSDTATTSDPVAIRLDEPAPEWDQIAQDVRCPLCEYNLRGLPHPRCPECGGRFTWRELFEMAAAGHPYLFELHPESNVRSYLRTALGAMRPRRFWTAVSPTLVIRQDRLVAYWAIGACLAFLISLPALAACSLHLLAFYGVLSVWPRRTVPGLPAGSLRSWIANAVSGGSFTWSDLSDAVFSTIPQALRMVAFFVAWGLLTLAAMQVFRISMRRARIRTAHTLRTVVYSFDPLVWGLMPVVLFAVLVSTRGMESGLTAALVWPAGIVLCGWRLYRAYRHYLRFDHPFCTVLAGQIIVLLLMGNLLLFMPYLL